MSESICMICKEFNGGEQWTLVVRDDKEKIEILAHKSCVNELENQIKQVKDREKKSPTKILKEIKFEL